MMNTRKRLFPHLFYLVITLYLTACTGQKRVVELLPEEIKTSQKSLIVLLPEDSKGTGEVTVVNPHGSQVLNKPWQAVEIAGEKERPTVPVAMDKTTVNGVFAEVLTAMPAPVVHYILYFRQNTAVLTPDSQRLLPEVLKAVNKRYPAQLSVVGHTDTMGTAEYNYQLGLRRAKTVASMLKSLGTAPAIIETTSHGKTDLLVKTGDQTAEKRNRRVEITIR
jgi:outer membrane protein OmpA-like peptidoglycan-associated protein